MVTRPWGVTSWDSGSNEKMLCKICIQNLMYLNEFSRQLLISVRVYQISVNSRKHDEKLRWGGTSFTVNSMIDFTNSSNKYGIWNELAKI